MLPVIEPMLATLGRPADLGPPDAWRYEVKWDGYRAVASVDGRATFRSRGGLDLTKAYPELGELADLLTGHQAVLDGEVVALLPDGRADFGALQNRGSRAGVVVHYMAFDLLHLDETSTLTLPYVDRRELLESLIDDGRHVHVPTTFGDDYDLASSASVQLRLEGLVAKRPGSAYAPGRRSRDWLKLKNVWTQDVIVVGWKPGEGRRGGTLGSLLLAVQGPDGLTYVGHAGTGFTETSLTEALALLAPLARRTPPVPDVPAADARGIRWVEPVLVGEVGYGSWTGTGRLRHPVWRGWRPDKSPDEVVRDG